MLLENSQNETTAQQSNTHDENYKSTNVKDFVIEGNEIKRMRTQPTSFTSDFIFSGLSEIILTGTEQKKTQPQLLNHYVPDTMMLITLINAMYELVRSDRALRRDDDICAYGTALYVNYCLMYIIILKYNQPFGITT